MFLHNTSICMDLDTMYIAKLFALEVFGANGGCRDFVYPPLTPVSAWSYNCRHNVHC